MDPLSFTVEHQTTSGARLGRLSTPHGEVTTPAFMPCASRAVVRACSPDDLEALGVQMMVCNTHHLRERPGAEIIESLGGLHAFMSWSRPLATDSGGFQAYSLAAGEVGDEGLRLRSPVNGTPVTLTAADAIRTQEALGADIIVALDVCPPYPATHAQVRRAVDLTLRWAELCLAAHTRRDQWLCGVVQGGVYPDLRRFSAVGATALGFRAFGIGGLSVGESTSQMLSALEVVQEHLPTEAPKWMMGVGTPRDIVACVIRGVDIFDCVLPTRMARHGSLITSAGPLKINNAACRDDPRPIDPSCDCPACSRYSRAYLHHLFRLEEAAAWRLLSLHNLRYYTKLMERIRAAIRSDTLTELLAELPPWTKRDEEAL